MNRIVRPDSYGRQIEFQSRVVAIEYHHGIRDNIFSDLQQAVLVVKKSHAPEKNRLCGLINDGNGSKVNH